MGFEAELTGRILVLDGAMGTMIQRAGLPSGDNELLNLEHPDVILGIHKAYIEAGADIIETNSFGANSISQSEYGESRRAPLMAYEAARIARQAADAAPRRIWVAGSVGPTGKSLTLPSDASDTAFRQYSFEQMKEAYREQIEALVRGGADIILLETCFDALNTKSAICALRELRSPLPVIISVTSSDRSGRTLTGQTLEAFFRSVRHAPRLAAFGINCSLGAEQMSVLAAEIATFSDLPLIFCPNAGIPDALGCYADSPQTVAGVIKDLASRGILNIAGGCCGTTPEHTAAIAKAVSGYSPRVPREPEKHLIVSGLESIQIDRSRRFVNIGERTNVAGSRRFARLISEGKQEEALQVARAQIEGGASIIDINMDDPMLDSSAAMRDFLRCIASDPSVAKAAIMIDSSHWDTIVAGLQNVQGRSIVNSISLKDGEQEFLRRARFIRDMGAAVVVMAFDEEGQATTLDRKIEICRRSYRLLVDEGIAPWDIIFDVNVLSIGTGIPEHSRFGVDFIEAVRWIKANLPGALTSGGISNLSFAFRGQNAVREAMHSAFLYHAIGAGLDMAIVNPQMLQVYDAIDSELLKCVEDVIFDSDPQATARLVAKASETVEDTGRQKQATAKPRPSTPALRLCEALLKGGSDTLTEDVLACLGELGEAVKVIEGPLMKGMEQVGERFADGRMFLPQVVRSAKVMRDAVDVLEPYMSSTDVSAEKPRAVIATVQGDVHDIGKNITSIVLQCSGFEVFDLGVMVPCADILAKSAEVNADIIGLSGLITPSLSRMEEVCREMASRGMSTPLFVGGAAASAVHTAVKLSPLYPNVHYGADASATAVKAKRCLLDPVSFKAEESEEHARLRELRQKGRQLQTCSCCTPESDSGQNIPEGQDFLHGRVFEDIPLKAVPAQELMPFFDWKLFFSICGLKGEEDEQMKREAEEYIASGEIDIALTVRFLDCHREGDDIVSADGTRFPMLRDRHSLADFFPTEGYSQMGLFAARVSGSASQGTGYPLQHAVRAALAEAASAMLQDKFSGLLSGNHKLIMPGIGYSCCPDHSLKRDILSLLPGTGITLTDSCAMIPETSVCGMVIAHRYAHFTDIRHISKESLDEYSIRRGFSPSERTLFLGHLSD